MQKIKTVILCGGSGYRLKEETEFKPKPMIEIGGKPILWHIMKIYSYWGFRDFVIALGYKGNLIKDYFVNKKYYDGDFTLNTATHKFKHETSDDFERLRITFVDTGLESLTGERIRRVKKYIDSDEFMLTYGDGLADINIKELLAFHRKQKALGTVTAVNPVMKYGGFILDKSGSAVRFEKRIRVDRLVNGGFMVFKKKVFDYINADSMIEDMFFPLIEKNKLAVYQHKKFFHSMDTYQDMQDLNELWKNNPAWKIWR